VIAAAVDGLPEAVTHGTSGVCIPPALPLADYVALGGRLDGLPPLVYDPQQDRLAPPRLVDPAALAAAVRELFADAAEYERASARASAHVRAKFDFDRHVAAVFAAIETARRARSAAA
jgi:glycosyltransferase involved in cell wall biosynthesis